MKKIIALSVIYFSLVAVLCDGNKWVSQTSRAGDLIGHVGIGLEGLTQTALGRTPNVDESGYSYTSPVSISSPAVVAPFADVGIEKNVTEKFLLGAEVDAVNIDIAPELAPLFTARDFLFSAKNNRIYGFFGGGFLVPVASKSFNGVTNNANTQLNYSGPLSYAGRDVLNDGLAFKIGIGDDFSIGDHQFFAQGSYFLTSQTVTSTGNYIGVGAFSGNTAHEFNTSAVMGEIGWRFTL